MKKKANLNTRGAWFEEFFKGSEYHIFCQEWMTPDLTRKQVDGCHWLLELRAGQRLLDVCSGPGRHVAGFRELGIKAVGLDLSQHQLGRAETALPLMRADARNLPIPDASQDRVTCLFNSFGYFSDTDNRQAFREMVRVLRPGGGLALQILNRDAFLQIQPWRTWDPHEDGFVLQELFFDVSQSRILTDWIYLRSNGQQHRVNSSVRLFSAHELLAWSRESGLQGKIHGDLTGAPLDWRHSPWLVLEAWKG